MRCEDCGWECECEDEESEPFIGPRPAPTEDPPTLQEYMAAQLAAAIFATEYEIAAHTLTGLTTWMRYS